MAKDDLMGVEDDDVNDQNLDDGDDGDDGDEPELTIEEIMQGLGGSDDDDDSDDDDNDEKDTKDENETDEPELTPEMEAMIQKRVDEQLVEKLNKIVPERLQRDRKTKEVSRLEQIAGMPLEKITETVIANMVADKADELGISEEEAREILKDKIENVTMKTEKLTEQQHQTDVNAAMQQVNYLKDKTEFTRQPKLGRFLTPDIVAEIDAFSGNGSVLSFEEGMKYILGTKLASGELLNKVQTGAAQKAKANASVKGKSTPRSGGGASKSENNVSLTREQRQMAAGLGLTSKEDLKAYAVEVQREATRKQKKSR